jgi:hypothetical protein
LVCYTVHYFWFTKTVQTPLGAGKERASSCRVVFFRGLLGCLLVSFVVSFGFFSGSRVFLLGFVLLVFFLGFFLFFVLALATRVYLRCT